MKKLVIIFGIILVLINSIALFVVSNVRVSSVSYKMLVPEPGMLWEDLLYYSEAEKAMAADGLWTNLSAETAVRIVQMLIFDNSKATVRRPYHVVHDDENRVFIVLAESTGDSVYRIIISQDTGGILLKSIIHRAGIPRMPDVHP